MLDKVIELLDKIELMKYSRAWEISDKIVRITDKILKIAGNIFIGAIILIAIIFYW